MRRALVAVMVVGVAVVAGAGPALACGGLIGRNGAVNLGRTTTLAAYAAGVEHYVTAFEFNGAGGEFGSIVPLPGVPTNVERGGDWTLQRLVREVTPIEATNGRADLQLTGAKAATARELINTRIDALDLTVLEGGGKVVGDWAREHGFLLPPDSPEVLDFYAERSPIFLAARFNGAAAASRGTSIGDGTPIHLTIPTPRSRPTSSCSPSTNRRCSQWATTRASSSSGRRAHRARSSPTCAPTREWSGCPRLCG